VRELNEDFVFLAPEHNLFLVADGMGGHASGNVASSLAAKSIRNFFEATAGVPFDEPLHPDDGDAPAPGRRLASAIRKANRDIHEISTTQERHKGMGSTLVAIHLAGEDIFIAHVGDSRCYRTRGGELQPMTRDHSLYNEALALKPDLSPARLAKLPKNVITRALGMSATVKVELRREKLAIGDQFLLCSDGLTGMVKDDDILGLVGLSDDLKESCELLIAMANEAGGSDNISVVLVRVDGVVTAPAVVRTPVRSMRNMTGPVLVISAEEEEEEPEADPELAAAIELAAEAELAAELAAAELAAQLSTRPPREPYAGPELHATRADFSGEIEEVYQLTESDEADGSETLIGAFELSALLAAPLPEPSDETLVPQPVIALDEPIDELIAVEIELFLEESERAERHARVAPGRPRCSRCEAPILPDTFYCVDCGLASE
jgi:protein phosphatase